MIILLCKIKMNFDDPNVKKWLGANLEKGRTNYNSELSRVSRKFQQVYPNARIEQFEFWVDLGPNG